MIRRWTLQQIRLFEAVARHRSYTRAAEELHLSQPAVSIQIKRLEESIGMPLLEQLGKKIFLTRAGEEVYATAVGVLNQLKQLAASVGDLKGHVAGPLCLACVTSAQFFMPHFLGRFLREHPEVQPQLKVTNRERVIERLISNEDDFVVMGQVPDGLTLSSRPFLENLLVPISYRDHPLAHERDIPLERFAAENHLIREVGSGTRSAMEGLVAEHRRSLNVYMELGSTEAIKQAVIAGLGVSVVSASTLSAELESGRIAILDVVGFPLRRTWNAVHLAGKHLSLTAATFLEFMVREGAAELASLQSIMAAARSD
ncbi:LysR family transcriptional regulator [Pinisolibacter sp.]|uniref:LysR family transcriptional regulator n=1 Tax=Pinisolibacter sp. TaxID=2172024 RepID=UPI002FDDB2DB